MPGQHLKHKTTYCLVLNLLILGGNRYNVPGIQSAKKNGFYTIVVDKNKSAAGFEFADISIPIDIATPEDLLEYILANKIQIDGVVPMAEVGVIPAAYISEKLNLKSLTLEVAKVVTNKYFMREKWQVIPKYNIKFTKAGNEKELFQPLNHPVE